MKTTKRRWPAVAVILATSAVLRIGDLVWAAVSDYTSRLRSTLIIPLAVRVCWFRRFRRYDAASLAAGELSPDFSSLSSQPINLIPDRIVTVEWRTDIDPPQCIVTYWSEQL